MVGRSPLGRRSHLTALYPTSCTSLPIIPFTSLAILLYTIPMIFVWISLISRSLPLSLLPAVLICTSACVGFWAPRPAFGWCRLCSRPEAPPSTTIGISPTPRIGCAISATLALGRRGSYRPDSVVLFAFSRVFGAQFERRGYVRMLCKVQVLQWYISSIRIIMFIGGPISRENSVKGYFGPYLY